MGWFGEQGEIRLMFLELNFNTKHHGKIEHPNFTGKWLKHFALGHTDQNPLPDKIKEDCLNHLACIASTRGGGRGTEEEKHVEGLERESERKCPHSSLTPRCHVHVKNFCPYVMFVFKKISQQISLTKINKNFKNLLVWGQFAPFPSFSNPPYSFTTSLPHPPPFMPATQAINHPTRLKTKEIATVV